MPKKTNRVDLKTEVTDWLSTEGYPLEFFTASAFHKAGFNVRQGQYVSDGEKAREVDVTADCSIDTESNILSVRHLIECKWSKGKPWVVFLSDRCLTPSELIAQLIASEVAQTILWAAAANLKLQQLELLRPPHSPGFGGREVFGDRNDVFYNTVQSVGNKSLTLAATYNRPGESEAACLKSSCIVFPIIVLDGMLFSARYNQETQKIAAEEQNHIRLHWRGLLSWSHHATIDIVNKSHVENFAKQRFKETSTMLRELSTTVNELDQCIKKSDTSVLQVYSAGSKGIAEPPHFFNRLKQRSSEIAKMRHRLKRSGHRI